MDKHIPVAAGAVESLSSSKRRRLLTASSGAALMATVDPLIRAGAWAAGSDGPEKKEIRIGFIPLTDCASVVMASVLEMDKKYGVKIIPSKESSWASVRGKLVNGDHDFQETCREGCSGWRLTGQAHAN